MRITITVPCGNNKHPITLDISNWNKWVIADSPCIQQYGKLFGSMMPCAEYFKHQTNNIYKKIIKALSSEKENKQKAIRELQKIATMSKSRTIVEAAIKGMAKFGEDAIHALHNLLTKYDTEPDTQIFIHKIFKKLKEKQQIKIPETTEHILNLIKAIEKKNTHLKRNALQQIITYNIQDAAPIIFYNIRESSKNKELYLQAFLQIEPNALEIAMQKIQTGEYLQREPAILILEAIDPPNLLDIACETANGFGTTEKIAARIIQNKAKTTDINRLLDIITKANFTIPVNAACDTITKICPTNAQNIFFEYLETNQNIQDWKRRIIIGYIAESDVKRYNQNPLQVFDDFKPNEIELLEFLKGILKNKHYTEETKQQIIQTITEELEENLPPSL